MNLKLDANQRILWPAADIDDRDRIRTDYGDLDDLARSIKENGLIHPPVINTRGRLVAGGRRFRAMRDKLKWTEIPVTFFEFADEATLRILEREENVRRKQMTWQEEVMSIADVHQHHSIDKALSGQRWTQRATGELLGMSNADVSYTLTLAELIRLKDKEIMGCKFFTDALHLLVKRRAEQSNAVVAKLTLPKLDPEATKRLLEQTELGNGDASSIFSALPGASSGGVASPSDDGEMPGVVETKPYIIPLSKMLIRGDAVEILRQIPDASIDHVITDWPYAEDMSNLQQAGAGMDVSSTSAEHGVEANRKLQADIVPEIFRVLKPTGFFITWLDLGPPEADFSKFRTNWDYAYDLCYAAGFKIQRWPLTWFKTSRCQNLAANYNFTKNAENAIVCRKDKATLVTPQPSSVWPGSNEAEEKLLGHPFAKPFKMWEWLYAAVAIRGQTVLDPFAGRGSSTLAALSFGLNPIAIETNEAHHTALVVNVSEWYRKSLKNVEFV